MAHASTTKEKALKLRKEGYSYNYILKSVPVPVAKSTLTEWFKNIGFTPNKHTLDTIAKARLASGTYKYHVRYKSLEKAEVQAKKDIGMLSERDIMMLGLGLYVGEGGKTNDIVRIINSDPKVIKLGIKWLKNSFGVSIKNIKVRLFIYPDSVEKDCVAYWSEAIGIPANQFFKPTIDTRTNKKKSNKGKLPFGTAHVSVQSLGNADLGVYLHRRIMACINRVL